MRLTAAVEGWLSGVEGWLSGINDGTSVWRWKGPC